ncbi:MAG: ATP-binding protein [Methanomicrobiaceae archaeon]|nr:ATP-binding protein [Methanomicrobiaceae archaeon]
MTCASTEEVRPLEQIIGQERALRALHFGLEIREKGFNVYAAGFQGTGRYKAVRSFIESLRREKPVASDWIYVNNFENQYEPNAIRMPAGTGSRFKKDMSDFVDQVRQVLPKAFQSDEYASQREETIGSLQAKRNELIERINQSAREKGFVITPTPVGVMTVPAVNGRQISEEEFAALPPEKKEEIRRRREVLDAEARDLLRQIREIETRGGEAIEELNRKIAVFAMEPHVSALKGIYGEIDEVSAYIDAVQKDILENIGQFLGVEQQQQQQQQLPPQLQAFLREAPLRKYEVNVLVDNTRAEGAPVVFEQNPTYQNLFGKVEKEVQFGALTTDFTMIRPGAMHRANGGYLILMAEDLLRNPFAWEGLKMALKTERIRIEEPGEQMGFITVKTIKSEPIPLAVKVAVIGNPRIYQLLFSLDPDFQELFKVKADFDIVMDRNEENAGKYVEFVCSLAQEFDLRHLDREALAKVVEYGSRLAEDQLKLSTRFSTIADLIKEANYYAALDGTERIGARQVRKAIEERIYRSNLIQKKIEEYMKRGILIINTEGSMIGQVNGLSVAQVGDFAFGRPSRVTASIGIGREGIVDIEREAALGGPIHTKGVLILNGYLTNKYAMDKPLSLSARLVFEQSYQGVEGDSASSTELYALLSALSDLPLRQSIAVTGSVDQRGDVQAIGGVNEKIEGFYEVCKAIGLNGDQGVMIPASNVQNLMLKEEIVEAAEAGKFRIYPVRTIDEGIEILTGVPAGERRPDGTYEEGTVNWRVNRQLQAMAERMKEYQLLAH